MTKNEKRLIANKISYAIGERDRCREDIAKVGFDDKEYKRLEFWNAYWTGQIEALNLLTN